MKQKNRVISIALATVMLFSLCAVCASTSVSAADSGSSRASVKASPDLVGAPIPADTGPSSFITKDERYFYLFVKGYDGALWYNREDLAKQYEANWGWEGWKSLGGQLSSSPCAVSRQDGVINVYVRGTNGAVYARPYSNGAWHAWGFVGGQVAPGTGPGASGWPGREDVFVEGTNGALYQKTWTSAGGWSSWTNLGGVLTSSPAANSRTTGLIDVHVRGTNGADYYRSYYNGAWHAWAYLGGQLKPGTGPAVSVWRALNREDVFIVDTNGALCQKTWTAASGWTTTWAYLGGHLTSTPSVAMLAWAIEVHGRFTDGFIYLKEYFDFGGGKGFQWTDWMGGSMDGPPGIL
jgi:hypothetical protein